jgi:hypothetical protein
MTARVRHWAHAVCIAALLTLTAAGTGCESSQDEAVATWRADCPTRSSVAPMSLEAARDAHRSAARRHAARLREAAVPGSFLAEMHATLDPRRLAAGEVCLEDLAERGRMLFEHEYGFADGLGSAPSATNPVGPFRRVHAGAFGGPETISCPSCHWVGGPNGAGAETDNVFLTGDGARSGSADARNPPALLGLGVVQALAREMTRDLQAARADLVRRAGHDGAPREVRLTTKGVDFGVLRASAGGDLDTSGVRGVDLDLVVKPFGWKGTMATVAEFSTDALQVHLGIQNAVLLANGSPETYGPGEDETDRDADGVRRELDSGPFTAMVAHLALLELPIVEPLVQTRQLEPAGEGMFAPTTTSFAEDFQRGRRQFHALGCAECHVPMLVLKSPIVELDGLPPIDLSRAMRAPALTYDPLVGGYPVWLFSDLRRHDMGAANRARHVQRAVATGEYLTPRLWGAADSAPYLHDGRAPSFDYAIAGHDGKGAPARAAYTALSREEKGDLRVYLMSLRRAPRLTVP